jgi:cytochrome c6
MNWHRLLFAGVTLVFVGNGVFAAAQSTQDLYKSRCQGCHGADGRGSVVGQKLGAKAFHDPAVARMSHSALKKTISDGKNKMPAYKGKLTEQQIDALVKYIREIK